MDWKQHYQRYVECLDIPNPEESSQCIHRLVSHVCSHFPSDGSDDLEWLMEALRDDRKRAFAKTVLKKKSPIPQHLAIPLVDAAVMTADPDGCIWFL
ncbi:MAG: hypothetical protein HKN13_13230 [Rhodothermales bacterium]|nr:hypothetical protein [Rhodothermales bacterium]